MMRFFNLLLALTLLSCGVAWATTYDSQGRTYVLDPNCALYCGTLASVGNTASSVPAAAEYVGVNVGGNLVGLAPGTAGSASSQVFSVQGIASMTPLLIGNSQGSTTSGQSGPLVQGAVTTAAPSYTTAQTSPLSLTTAGGLRSDVASVAGNTVLTGNGATGTGALRISIASDSTGVVRLQDGSGTALVGAAPADGATLSTTSLRVYAVNGVYNGTTIDLARGMLNSTNTSGTGVAAAGQLGQCDDVSPTSLTENNFGNVAIDCTNHTQLVGALVTTSAPSYTTGTSRGMSLTTAGGLRSDLSSVAGTTTLTGNGTAGAGAQRVTIASDNSAVSGFGVGATGSAPPANASYLGANSSGATGGLLAGLRSCDSSAKYDASTSGSTQIIAGVSGRKVYFCGILFATGGTATNVKLVEGTGTNCATSPADVTPAYQLAANDARGFMSPFWTGLVTATNANNVCINASAANAVQAQVFYTIQ